MINNLVFQKLQSLLEEKNLSSSDKEHIYLQNLGDHGGFKIWYVDGFYIRNNIEEEFTNFAQHYRFKFIPEDEFWIDKEFAPGEVEYFVSHLLVENRLMKEGKSYDIAVDTGEKAEKRERRKSMGSFKSHNPAVLNRIHKKLIYESKKGLKVWIVNGELVRDLYYVDFTEGGHYYVYNFVPKEDVWIDDDLNPKEIPFVLLHELNERYLMRTKGWPYNKAHFNSSHLEYTYRRNPSGIEDHIKKLVEDEDL